MNISKDNPLLTMFPPKENTAFSQLTNLDLNTWNTDQVIDIESMFGGCKNLIRLNMRNATFNATNYLLMFNAVPNGITITVKDNTAKTWIEARLREVNKTGNVIIG